MKLIGGAYFKGSTESDRRRCLPHLPGGHVDVFDTGEFGFPENVSALGREMYKMSRRRRVAGYALERYTACLANDLLFQSYGDYQYVLQKRWKHSKHLHYVGNGIDINKFSRRALKNRCSVIKELLGIPGDALVVGTVARLVYEKGVMEFLHLAERHGTGTKWFVLIGPGEPDQRDAVPITVLRRLESRRNFRYIGYKEDPREYFLLMDVFCLLSRREGIPRVILEASSLELPVLAPNIRGCREVVRHGVTLLGFLSSRMICRLSRMRLPGCWPYPTGGAPWEGRVGSLWQIVCRRARA